MLSAVSVLPISIASLWYSWMCTLPCMLSLELWLMTTQMSPGMLAEPSGAKLLAAAAGGEVDAYGGFPDSKGYDGIDDRDDAACLDGPHGWDCAPQQCPLEVGSHICGAPIHAGSHASFSAVSSGLTTLPELV